jgi:hypothetical protein
VMTCIRPLDGGRLLVQGASVDDGTVKVVSVNGRPARAVVPDYSRWEVTIDVVHTDARPITLVCSAEDAAGNRELVPHRAVVTP